MLNHVLPANIENERDLRLQRHDVGEVLLRSDAKICTLSFAAIGQVRQHALKCALVGDEVVRDKGSTRFGKLADDVPEHFIADLDGEFFCGPRESKENEKP